MSNQLTAEQFQAVLPKQMRKSVSTEVMNGINVTMSGDSVMKEHFRENLLSYTNVMKDGKFKIHQYIDAVKYVSYKLMGDTNLEAYTKTFPQRYARFVAMQTSNKDISSYVAGYNKTKLVNLILEQTLVPTHILNADVYQQAINMQAKIMMDEDVSPKVRSDAANSLLTHLKAPETKKIELEVNNKQDSVIDDLRATTEKLVLQQQAMLKTGNMSARDMAEAPLVIQGECEEV